MANLEVAETPSFSKELEKLETTTPAHANVFNGINTKLLENEIYLEQKKADKSLLPTALKSPFELTLQLDGTSQGAYDGSVAKTVNITTSSIGAAPASHSHSANQVTGLPSSLPANGGNADTTDGYHFMVATSKPPSLSNNVICFVYE